MGLDMYLQGRKSSRTPENEDGYEVSHKILELGYWRKHADLHGFIILTFAEGVDECQEIYLERGCIEKIINAINNDLLPHTEGFFFGESLKKGDEEYEEQKQEDIKIFTDALNWLKDEKNGEYRCIFYQASW